MTKTELEFQVNDIFEGISRAPALVKLIIVLDLVILTDLFRQMFGGLFDVLTGVAMVFLCGWSFGDLE